MTKQAHLATGAVGGLAATVSSAPAQDIGVEPWQMTFPEPATRLMDYIAWFGNFTLVIVSIIVVFVMALMAWCIVRYGHRANPQPRRFSHNTTIEVLWTVLPVFILVIIAIPSFRLLYGQFDPAKFYDDFDPDQTPFLTVKATGYQWYWGYEYGADEDSRSFGVGEGLGFDSLMLQDDERGDDDPRLLAVDNQLVVPVDTFVRVQVTAADVIHAFAVPAFGIKIDAVPGRLNETYFRAEREGVFYGQCSELCGKDHAYMPIAVRVVSANEFGQWAAAAADDLQAANAALAAAIAEKAKERNVAAR